MAKPSTVKKNKPLSKSAILQAVSDAVGEEVSRKHVKEVVEALVEVGHKELKKNGLFVLHGFAKFVVVKKPAKPPTSSYSHANCYATRIGRYAHPSHSTPKTSPGPSNTPAPNPIAPALNRRRAGRNFAASGSRLGCSGDRSRVRFLRAIARARFVGHLRLRAGTRGDDLIRRGRTRRNNARRCTPHPSHLADPRIRRLRRAALSSLAEDPQPRLFVSEFARLLVFRRTDHGGARRARTRHPDVGRRA